MHTRCAVNQLADNRIFIQFAQEFTSLEIISYLSNLERDTSIAKLLSYLLGSILDGVENCSEEKAPA